MVESSGFLYENTRARTFTTVKTPFVEFKKKFNETFKMEKFD